eukprot:1188905-Pyramimonas_sp.AAC.1
MVSEKRIRATLHHGRRQTKQRLHTIGTKRARATTGPRRHATASPRRVRGSMRYPQFRHMLKIHSKRSKHRFLESRARGQGTAIWGEARTRNKTRFP